MAIEKRGKRGANGISGPRLEKRTWGVPAEDGKHANGRDNTGGKSIFRSNRKEKGSKAKNKQGGPSAGLSWRTTKWG